MNVFDVGERSRVSHAEVLKREPCQRALEARQGERVGELNLPHAVYPIADLQIEYSLISRGPEAKIFPLLAELGIGVTAYGVLSRGLLSGSRPAGASDFRGYLPRFKGDNRARNERLVAALQASPAAKGVTATQLAIAWVLARDERIVPVIGARTRAQLEESLTALDLVLSAEDLAQIEDAVPASDRVLTI